MIHAYFYHRRISKSKRKESFWKKKERVRLFPKYSKTMVSKNVWDILGSCRAAEHARLDNDSFGSSSTIKLSLLTAYLRPWIFLLHASRRSTIQSSSCRPLKPVYSCNLWHVARVFNSRKGRIYEDMSDHRRYSFYESTQVGTKRHDKSCRTWTIDRRIVTSYLGFASSRFCTWTDTVESTETIVRHR